MSPGLVKVQGGQLAVQIVNAGAVEQRWVSELARSDFEIHYRPGHQNGCVDALSRQTQLVAKPAFREKKNK